MELPRAKSLALGVCRPCKACTRMPTLNLADKAGRLRFKREHPLTMHWMTQFPVPECLTSRDVKVLSS
eukprot:2714977-Amphidinium_carterae.1